MSAFGRVGASANRTSETRSPPRLVGLRSRATGVARLCKLTFADLPLSLYTLKRRPVLRLLMFYVRATPVARERNPTTCGNVFQTCDTPTRFPNVCNRLGNVWQILSLTNPGPRTNFQVNDCQNKADCS